jgi:hypothetical protein
MCSIATTIPACALSPLDADPSLNEGTQQSLSEMAMHRYTKTATAAAVATAEAEAAEAAAEAGSTQQESGQRLL